MDRNGALIDPTTISLTVDSCTVKINVSSSLFNFVCDPLVSYDILI
jgi:hypothetical protein